MASQSASPTESGSLYRPHLSSIATDKKHTIARYIPDAPCMDYLPTLGEKWPHSIGNVVKCSLDGASGYFLLTKRGELHVISMSIFDYRMLLEKNQILKKSPTCARIQTSYIGHWSCHPHNERES